MVYITKNFNKFLLGYIVILTMLVLSQTEGSLMDSKAANTIFLVGRDLGNFISLAALFVYAFEYSKVKDLALRELILKNVIKTLLLLIVLNFSKTIVGLALDFSTLTQYTFFNAYSNNIFLRVK